MDGIGDTFLFQFSGSRPDKITHNHIEGSDVHHDPSPGDRNHEDYKSCYNHPHSFLPVRDPHQVGEYGSQQEQPCKHIEDYGRESDQEDEEPLYHYHSHDDGQ